MALTVQQGLASNLDISEDYLVVMNDKLSGLSSQFTIPKHKEGVFRRFDSYYPPN